MFGKRRHNSVREGPVIRDPMAVIPVVPPHVETRTDSRGLLHLRYRVQVAGIPRMLASLFGAATESFRYVDLDEAGSAFFSLVDGQRSMREVVSAMAEKLGRNRTDVEKAAIAFARQLMARHLIQLRVTPQSLGEETR